MAPDAVRAGLGGQQKNTAAGPASCRKGSEPNRRTRPVGLVRSRKFWTEKVSEQAAGSATQSPGRTRLAGPVMAVWVMSVSFQAGRRDGGGQVVAGDVMDLDTVRAGQQREILARHQFGAHHGPGNGVQGLH